MVFAAIASASAFSGPAFASPPVVVELFQSQGCSSCPPANENILALIDHPDLLVLSFGVTYWDRLGWKDTFASHENTQRQYAYANGGLKRRNVATPQVVINGYVDIVGNDRSELVRAIGEAKLLSSAPALAISGANLSILAATAPPGGAEQEPVGQSDRLGGPCPGPRAGSWTRKPVGQSDSRTGWEDRGRPPALPRAVGKLVGQSDRLGCPTVRQ
ncbi:MAG: DUF1223 domain-containing protein, partial [Burkholderiales bacterium]